jgi:hypothetical protein
MLVRKDAGTEETEIGRIVKRTRNHPGKVPRHFPNRSRGTTKFAVVVPVRVFWPLQLQTWDTGFGMREGSRRFLKMDNYFRDFMQ